MYIALDLADCDMQWGFEHDIYIYIYIYILWLVMPLGPKYSGECYALVLIAIGEKGRIMHVCEEFPL